MHKTFLQHDKATIIVIAKLPVYWTDHDVAYK